MNSRILTTTGLALVACSLPLFADLDDFDDAPGYASALEGRLAHLRAASFNSHDRLQASGIEVFGQYTEREFDGESRRVLRESEAWGGGGAYTFGWDSFALRLQLEWLDVDAEYRETDVATNPAHGSVESSGGLASVQGGYFVDNWSFSVFGGFGYADNEGTRVNGATTSAKGSFDSSEYFIGTRAEYRFELSERAAFVPFASLSYARVSTDSFDEKDPSAGPIDLRRVDGFDLDLTTLALGIDYVGDYGNWGTRLGVAWISALENAEVAVPSESQGVGFDQAGKLGNAFDDSAVLLHGGLDFSLGEGWSFGPNASIVQGSDETTWSVALRLNGNF